MPASLVHPGARLDLHLVGEEPVLAALSDGAPLMQRDLGVAVEKDLLEVVRELEIVDRLLFPGQRRVPSRLADRLALCARKS